MPISLPGQFLYALLLVAIYGAPVFALLLWWGWKRRRALSTSIGVLISIPILAGTGLLLLHTFIGVAAENAQSRQGAANAKLRNSFAPMDDSIAIRGHYAGEIEVRGRRYRSFIFAGLWPQDPQRAIELRVARDAHRFHAQMRGMRVASTHSDHDAWLLLLWPPDTMYSPYGKGPAFLAERLPALEPAAASDEAYALHLDGGGLRAYRRPDEAIEPNQVWPSIGIEVDLESIQSSGDRAAD